MVYHYSYKGDPDELEYANHCLIFRGMMRTGDVMALEPTHVGMRVLQTKVASEGVVLETRGEHPRPLINSRVYFSGPIVAAPVPTGENRIFTLGRSFPHRLYLAECWLGWNHRMSAAGEQDLPIALIERSCPSLHERAPAVKRIDCDHICSPVLLAGSSHCLCCCGRHREECPVHRLT